MSQTVNRDAQAYDHEYDAFVKQLQEFHQHRGTSFRRLPRINGKGVDLYLLYVVVTSKGGWQKVNSKDEWDLILEDFRLPKGCINSSSALKHIYIRYLDAYERIHFHGEDGDEKSEMDEEESRAVRVRRAVRTLNCVPLSYNHQQHNVQEIMRSGAGFSTELYKPSQYEKLSMSLLSPLPNENDFAFNVCTILSNEGRHALQLSQCPHLVENILAHTGIYRDVETQRFFLSNYRHVRGRSLTQFWAEVLEDRGALNLLCCPEFGAIAPRPVACVRSYSNSETGSDCRLERPGIGTPMWESREGTPGVSEEDCEVPVSASDNTSAVNSERTVGLCRGSYIRPPREGGGKGGGPEEVIQLKESVESRLKKVLECDGGSLLPEEELELFQQQGRNVGILDAEGTRISQVLQILRNLSFEESNISVLAHSDTCLRFLVLCICSRNGALSVNALDTLGNIAHEVTLHDPVSDPCSALLLRAICQGVSSADRAFVLRSMEVLNKLATGDPNEDILNENMDKVVYNQICHYLTIHDIMLLIYTLECLYSLSSLGTPACDAIARAHGAVHTLISLLTVEAQSYGSEACIGMKVVETVTGVIPETEKAGAANPGTQVTITMPVLASGTVTGSGHANPKVAIPSTPTSVPSSDLKKMVRVVPPEVEEFVVEWVTKNYQSCPGNAIEQAVVYRHFAASMHSLGRKQGLNPVLLSNCVRKVFGTNVGPCRRQVEENIEKWHYAHIRRKDGVIVPPMPDKKKRSAPFPSTEVLIPTPLVAPSPPQRVLASGVVTPSIGSNSMPPTDSVTPPPPSSPILKAQLSAPLKPSTPVIKSQNYMNQPTGVGPLSHPNSQLSSRFENSNSATIKSLLANKVTPPMVSPGTHSVPPQHTLPPFSHIQALAQGPMVTHGGSPMALGLPGMYAVTHSNNPGIRPGQEGQLLPPASSLVQVSRNLQKQNPFEVESVIVNGICAEDKRVTSFQGILQNGIKSEEPEEVVLDSPSIGGEKRNVLADLLEKTVGGDLLNGVLSGEGEDLGIGRTNWPTTNGVKRPMDDEGIGAKRLAVEDPRGGTIPHDAGRMTLYAVSQNCGAEGQTGQVILSQGQQQIMSTQTVMTTQGQMIIQRPVSQGQVIMQQGGQILTQQGGQIVTQGQQKVYMQGQMIGGQVFLSQGAGGQQVLMQGVPSCQGYVLAQGNGQGQYVVASTQAQQQMLLSNGQGHAMIVGQPGQTGQMLVPQGAMGGTVLLAPQQQGGTPKTLIIFNNNQKMVLQQGQQVTSTGQLVLPRPVTTITTPQQQMVQVVTTTPTAGGNLQTTPMRAPPTRSAPTSLARQLASSLPPPPAGPAAVPVAQPATPTVSVAGPHIPAPQVLSSGVAAGGRRASKSGLQYLCEWQDCGRIFSAPNLVYSHACRVHCPSTLVEVKCQWAGCDTMVRKRFSAMTHLHDRHCSEQLLHVLAVRRQQVAATGKSDIVIPQAPPPHPGYAPNAAFHAIKRHALEVITQRDAVEKEGPVTKSIRLTSALILRNLVIYSNFGKKLLRGYEAELANVAISAMESSRTVSQILHDLHLPDHQGSV